MSQIKNEPDEKLSLADNTAAAPAVAGTQLMAESKTATATKVTTADDKSAVKAKKTKSRNGCLTCKKKRLKCGEEKPFCLNCVRKNIVCGGYSMNFKWRDFSQPNIAPVKMSRDSSIDTNLSIDSVIESNNNIKSQKMKNDGTSNNISQSQFNDQTYQRQQMIENQFLQQNPQLNHSQNFKQHQQPKIGSQKVPAEPLTSINNSKGTYTGPQKKRHHAESKWTGANGNTTEKQLPTGPVPVPTSSLLQKALEAATLSVTGKSTQEIAISNALIASGKNPDLAAAIASTLNGLVNSVEKQQLEQQQKSISPEPQQNNESQQNYNSQISKSMRPYNTVNLSNISKSSSSPDDDSTISSAGSSSRYSKDATTQQHSKKHPDHGIETSLDDESRNSLLSSLADVASRVSPSPASPPSGLSPLSMPSPSSMFMNQQVNFNQSRARRDSIPNSLNLYRDSSARSPMPFTPGNPLYEILNNATTAEGQLDSPKLLAQLNENPAAMEQYHNIISSPAMSSFLRIPMSPNTGGSNIASSSSSGVSSGAIFQAKPGVISPSFSTLINAFTNFDNDAPSPANFELIANSPNVPLSSAIHNQSELQKRNYQNQNYNHNLNQNQNQNNNNNDKNQNQNQNQVIMPGSLLHEQSPVQSHASLHSPDNQFAVLVKSPTNSEFSFVNQIPKTIEINDQAMKMMSAFDRYTCGIMSMKNGPTENPWRTLILPLSQEYPVMLNAVSAMTCFHVARGDSQLRTQGMKHMKNAIVELVHGLSDKTTPPDVALATCLALAMGEAWDRHVSTGIAHLKGARTMILQVLNNLQSGQKGNYITATGEEDSNGSNGNSPSVASMSRSSSFSSTTSSNGERKVPKELQFLFNAWVYFDVLARMTSDGADDEEEEGTGNQIIEVGGDGFSDYQSGNDRASSQPRKKKRKLNDSVSLIEKFQSFNLQQGDEVDPLLGIAQRLFPIIGNVATLISKVRKESKNSLSIVSSAVELKRELESWKPSSLRNLQIEDPLFDLASAIATAESYRYATLLYLHQAVPEIPSTSSHKLAEKILMLLASIPTSSRTCVTHIFPLLIASCEAKQGEEREWVKQRWELLSSKMWIGNIDRALEVVKEVWSRKDLLRRKKEQEGKDGNSNNNSAANHADDGEDDAEDGDGFVNLSKKINEALNGDDTDLEFDDDNRLKSWTHWTTVMKDWGWEVLLA